MKKLVLSALIIATSFFSISSFAAQNDNESQIKEIEQILRANPTIITPLHSSLQQYTDQMQKVKSILAENHNYIYHDTSHPFFGNKDAKMTIAFFTDYSCPWCKQLLPNLQKIIKKHPDIKVVELFVPFHEIRNQQNSATYALNVWQKMPAKFTQVDQLLESKTGTHDANSLAEIAKKTGTESALKVTDQSKSQVEKNVILFEKLGLQGTPALIINDEIIPGYLPLAQLEKVIDDNLPK